MTMNIGLVMRSEAVWQAGRSPLKAFELAFDKARAEGFEAGVASEQAKGCETCRYPDDRYSSTQPWCAHLDTFCENTGNRCGRWAPRVTESPEGEG